jgi:hypothetical protein
MITTSNSQYQVALLKLDSNSLEGIQVKVLFDMNDWDSNIQFLDLSLDCFVNFIELSSHWFEYNRR